MKPITEPHHCEASPYCRNIIDKKRLYFTVKRVTDIILSVLFIILILSWVLPIISLIIWIDTGGPVFFLQDRVGRAGRTFTCLKFRTMQPEMGLMRITALGNFLRKTNIDEFPQFINVLIGDMSVVGPRPHTYFDCRRFSEVVSRYKVRTFVKPGITGLAQIKGFHGPALDTDSIRGRYELDVWYVRNASLALDISIIKQTAVQSLTNLLGFGRPGFPVPNATSNIS